MSIVLRRDPKAVIPDFIDWFEEPFLTLRPYLGQPIRIEDYTEDGHYVVRAEIAGIDPEKELEVSVGAGYLSIRVERSGQAEGKHRSEFHYGAFARSVTLPEGADEDHIRASYDSGIMEVVVTLKDQAAGKAPKRIPVFMNKHIKPT